MPAAAIRDFEDRYGVGILEGYGRMEGTVVTTANPLNGTRRPRTVGLPLPGQEVRYRRRRRRTVASGTGGRGDSAGPERYAGLFGKPEETANTLRGGSLHSGDVGRFDDDGYLVLVHRLNNMIIRGGENMYPKEIETRFTRIRS